ncbi:helix-turn-helix transcriptional regulator [bacterium SCSIO 12844]|nr:helix-turn-helix transcriptional regulator [bacterium SCSIO 12844]
MPIKNKTVYAILGVLRNETLSGYEIHKRILTSMKVYWNEGYNSTYPCLKKMTDEGLVTLVEGHSNKSNTKYYQLTKSGIKHHRQWLNTLESSELTRNENLLKIFFSSQSDTEQCRRLVEYEKLKVDKLLMNRNSHMLNNNNELSSKDLINLYDQFILDAKQQWCNLILEKLY